MVELYAKIDRTDIPPRYLDLVALGIVADLAKVKDDTRWLLQQGLKVLRHSPRLGIISLCEPIDIDPKNITEEHITFYIAPRMNSLGRLGDANQVIEFLTTDNPNRAKVMAAELDI